MLVISYCQIYTFHPSLKLEKIVIFRSFQQSAEEIYDLGHFKRQHVEFWTTVHQLKDAATAVVAHEKSTCLAEPFYIELKFTVDALSNWFLNRIKTKFMELDDIKKRL